MPPGPGAHGDAAACPACRIGAGIVVQRAGAFQSIGGRVALPSAAAVVV